MLLTGETCEYPFSGGDELASCGSFHRETCSCCEDCGQGAPVISLLNHMYLLPSEVDKREVILELQDRLVLV